MTQQSTIDADHAARFPGPPAWARVGPPPTAPGIAFASGACLSMLDAALGDPVLAVPRTLLANTMALRAATAISRLEGRLARESDIRDAYHLTPPGEARGPDGELLALWRDAVRLGLSRSGWQDRLRVFAGPDHEPRIDGWLGDAQDHARANGPLAGCSRILRLVLSTDDRAERLACLLSDVVLARMLNWAHPLPISAQRLTRPGVRALIADGADGEIALQARLLDALRDTALLARDLAARAHALTTVAPRLRSKASVAAVDLFLAQDAIAPSTMLSPRIQGTNIPMTDRAARRFCSRLVELGVARELTGRSTFRLYGIGP
ncbi:DUF1403 family protein [Microbulbifer sp. S227A]|uniref:DUF1403 family protein n=1 Tax=Microbulbifer sp. S227A TaxID=3415131 RepID=UPI003C79E65B